MNKLQEDIIRKAVIPDATIIHKVLGRYGGQGLLLARPISEIYDHLRDFYVVHEGTPEGPIQGFCALGICWEDLAEIRSLAILEESKGKGLGTRLVETCLEEARGLGISRVFALTYVPEFFARMGFREVEKALLPQKVWGVCLQCPKFPDCDEIAVITDL